MFGNLRCSGEDIKRLRRDRNIIEFLKWYWESSIVKEGCRKYYKSIKGDYWVKFIWEDDIWIVINMCLFEKEWNVL